MKLFTSLFDIVLTLTADSNQRAVQPSSSNLSTDGMEKPTAIVINSDQQNTFKVHSSTCGTSKMEKTVIGLKLLNTFLKNLHLKTVKIGLFFKKILETSVCQPFLFSVFNQNYSKENIGNKRFYFLNQRFLQL